MLWKEDIRQDIQNNSYTGLNRQIRRMCAECGYSVTKLTRIRIMNVELGNLKTGEYRELDGKELNTLYEQIYKQIETVNIQADN